VLCPLTGLLSLSGCRSRYLDDAHPPPTLRLPDRHSFLRPLRALWKEEARRVLPDSWHHALSGDHDVQEGYKGQHLPRPEPTFRHSNEDKEKNARADPDLNSASARSVCQTIGDDAARDDSPLRPLSVQRRLVESATSCLFGGERV
jgi:hypothetical protein